MNYINIYVVIVFIIYIVLMYFGTKYLFFSNSIYMDRRFKLANLKYNINTKAINKNIKNISLKCIGKQHKINLQNKQNRELYTIIIQLKNMVVSQQNSPCILSYMLSKVIRFTKYTKPQFIKFITLIDLNQEKQAKKRFIEEINTPLARDLVYVLIQLDKIKPVEVVNQLDALQKRVENENITVKNKKEELYSDLMYVMPTILCFLILLNFLNILLSIINNLASL